MAGYYISKDKRTLGEQLESTLIQYWPTATQSKSTAALFRHPLTTIILSFFTLGFYSLYYVGVRRYFGSKTANLEGRQTQLVKADETFGQAIQAANDTRYTEAIETAADAMDLVLEAEQRDIAGVVGGDVEELQEQIKSAVTTWQAKRAKSQLGKAEQAANNDDYERALDTLRELFERLNDIDRQLVSDFSEIDDVWRRAQQRRFEWLEANARSTLERAESAADEDDYETAVEIAAEVVSELQKVTDRTDQEHPVETDSLEKLRDTAQQRRFEWLESSVRSTVEQAERAADESRYEAALETATEAASELQTAIEQAEEAGVDADSFEALQETITEATTEWERELLVSRINAAVDTDAADHEQASNELQQVLSALPETDALSESERSLLEREARDAYVTVRSRGVRHLLKQGTEQMDADDYAAAQETLSEAVKVAAETLDTAGEWDGVDIAEIESARDEAETAYVEAQLALVEDTFETGVSHFEAGEYDRAQEVFTTVSDDASAARGQIEGEDARERLADLAAVADENAEAAQRASLGIGREEPTLSRPDEQFDAGSTVSRVDSDEVESTRTSTHGGQPSEQPTEIPAVPDLDITYDALDRQDGIGKGGNADVYCARATVEDTTHELAVKEPRLQGTISTQVVNEFVREAETWSKLDDHDHIVGVIEWGTEPLPWIGMEYMDGGDLSERLENVSFREGIWIALSATEAIHHAHRRGVAHLDLKPENILFQGTDSDTWDVPKVADWGLAKMLLDHSNSIEGVTPRYAAPEQFDDATLVGQMTDIYQLGAVCYELFTGEPPFTGSPIEVVQKIAEEPVTPPTEVDPSLPAALDDALLPALAKETENRYEDVVYFRDSLRELSDESARRSVSQPDT